MAPKMDLRELRDHRVIVTKIAPHRGQRVVIVMKVGPLCQVKEMIKTTTKILKTIHHPLQQAYQFKMTKSRVLLHPRIKEIKNVAAIAIFVGIVCCGGMDSITFNMRLILYIETKVNPKDVVISSRVESFGSLSYLS